MFRIQWGTRTRDLGSLDTLFCPWCDAKRKFSLIFTYKYFGFWGVFNCCHDRKVHVLCDVCHQGREVDHKERPDIDNIPVYFLERFGCFLVVAIAALAIVVAVHASPISLASFAVVEYSLAS